MQQVGEAEALVELGAHAVADPVDLPNRAGSAARETAGEPVPASAAEHGPRQGGVPPRAELDPTHTSTVAPGAHVGRGGAVQAPSGDDVGLVAGGRPLGDEDLHPLPHVLRAARGLGRAQPSLTRPFFSWRAAWPMRCSFSIRAKRT